MITKEEWKKIRGSQNNPDHIMLTINGDARTSMTVTWRTCADIENGYALYRKKGESDWLRTDADTGRFDSDMDSSNIFWAHINALEPGEEYEYTCGNDEFRSEIYDFKTAENDLDCFEFLCLSDTQGGSAEPPADYSVLNEVVKEALRLHPDVRFILTSGDNTNCGQTDIQWTGLLDGMKGIIEHIPFMMSVGNHDDMGFGNYFTLENKYYSEKVEYFGKQFGGSYPDNGPEDWKTANYSFDYGNAHFCAIGLSGPEYVNEWLIKDTAESDKTWKFGSHHFPICYQGSSLSCEDSYPMLREGMEKFDVVFSGHEHCFSRSYPRRGDNLWDRPSEGTVFYNMGSGHRNPSNMLVTPKLWNCAYYPHEEELSMYAVARVQGKKLTLTSYLEGDKAVDQCVIDKENDMIYPIALAPVFRTTRLMFKGADLGLCMRTLTCEKIDGIWYVPVAVMFRYTGFDVEMSKGAVTVSAFRHKATFTENSRTVVTENGSFDMPSEVKRLQRGQLYVPADGICKAFKMRYSFFDRNNLLAFEHELEDKPVPEQP